MSEVKLCPLLPIRRDDRLQFQACLKNDCAWWNGEGCVKISLRHLESIEGELMNIRQAIERLAGVEAEE